MNLKNVKIHADKPIWFAKKILLPIVILAAYVLLAYLFSRHTPIYNPYGSGPGGEVHYVNATVLSIDSQSISPSGFPGLYTGRQTITVRMEDGSYKGRTFQITNPLNYDTNFILHKGEKIVVSESTSTGNKSYINVYMYAPNRLAPLIALLALFVAAICFVGRMRGFRSLLGIVFTLTTMLFVFIPLLYRGISALLAVLVLVVVTSCVTLFLSAGVNRKSLSAVLGTISGVVISIAVMLIFSKWLSISGYTASDTDSLLNIAGGSQLQVKDLLFAGIIISSLGAVMDIAISVATSVNEVFRHTPDADFRQLFSSGMNVGRDMMGTMANTLILAFVGSSVISFILMYSYQAQFNQLFNSSGIAVDILEAVCGSFAVILTVPIVSAITGKLLVLARSPGKTE